MRTITTMMSSAMGPNQRMTMNEHQKRRRIVERDLDSIEVLVWSIDYVACFVCTGCLECAGWFVAGARRSTLLAS